jgi:hypothetical protein
VLKMSESSSRGIRKRVGNVAGDDTIFLRGLVYLERPNILLFL